MSKTKKENGVVQITQIKIYLPNKEIELTADEARKVYEELYKIFLQENPPLPFKEKEYIHVPIYIDRWYPEPYWTPHKITCETPETTNFPDYATCLSINLTNNS